MAFRIGDYILRGELRNTRPNGVYGWIEFAPDYGIHIELTGNFKGQLQGKHIKFSIPSSQGARTDALPDEIESMADRQIGVVGDVLLRRVQVPTIPIAEFIELGREEQAKFCEEKDCLYLEWYSQNGRVVAEIIDPEIEFVDKSDSVESEPPEFEPLNDSYGVGVTEVYLDNDGVAHGEDDDELDAETEDDDPYGLFDENLERSVAEALGGSEPFPEEDPPDESTPRTEKRWDEVIPGIDPETKAMYEQWDEIFLGKKDEPVAYLFETPLRLPPPDKVTSDEEAESLVTSILAQLALLSVAVDVCEHYTPRQTYRLLMTEILPTAKVHPNLAASKMVQHYSTSDYCEACDADFDDEYDSENDEEEADE